MMSYLLFLNENGCPQEFYVYDCSDKSKVVELIKNGGGSVLDTVNGPYTIKLVSSDCSNNIKTDDLYSTDFIVASLQDNKLQQLSDFRLSSGTKCGKFVDQILRHKLTWDEACQKWMCYKNQKRRESKVLVLNGQQKMVLTDVNSGTVNNSDTKRFQQNNCIENNKMKNVSLNKVVVKKSHDHHKGSSCSRTTVIPRRKKLQHKVDNCEKEKVLKIQNCDDRLFFFDTQDETPPGSLNLSLPSAEYFAGQQKQESSNNFIFHCIDNSEARNSEVHEVNSNSDCEEELLNIRETLHSRNSFGTHDIVSHSVVNNIEETVEISTLHSNERKSQCSQNEHSDDSLIMNETINKILKDKSYLNSKRVNKVAAPILDSCNKNVKDHKVVQNPRKTKEPVITTYSSKSLQSKETISSENNNLFGSRNKCVLTESDAYISSENKSRDRVSYKDSSKHECEVGIVGKDNQFGTSKNHLPLVLTHKNILVHDFRYAKGTTPQKSLNGSVENTVAKKIQAHDTNSDSDHESDLYLDFQKSLQDKRNNVTVVNKRSSVNVKSTQKSRDVIYTKEHGIKTPKKQNLCDKRNITPSKTQPASSDSIISPPDLRSVPSATSARKRHNSSSSAAEQVSPYKRSKSSVSRSGTSNRKNRRTRRAYTVKEERQIIDFIIKYESYPLCGGNTFWIKMEKRKAVPNRSWHSLKEHFRKQMLPKIGKYNLTPDVLTKFQNIKNSTTPTKMNTALCAELFSCPSNGSEAVDQSASEETSGSRTTRSTFSSLKRLRLKEHNLSMYGKPGWRWNAIHYTHEEDMAIIRYILKHGKQHGPGGVALWKNLEKSNILCGRTHYSLKERFRKVIFDTLDEYEISEAAVKSIRELCKNLHFGRSYTRKVPAKKYNNLSSGFSHFHSPSKSSRTNNTRNSKRLSLQRKYRSEEKCSSSNSDVNNIAIPHHSEKTKKKLFSVKRQNVLGNISSESETRPIPSVSGFNMSRSESDISSFFESDSSTSSIYIPQRKYKNISFKYTDDDSNATKSETQTEIALEDTGNEVEDHRTATDHNDKSVDESSHDVGNHTAFIVDGIVVKHDTLSGGSGKRSVDKVTTSKDLSTVTDDVDNITANIEVSTVANDAGPGEEFHCAHIDNVTANIDTNTVSSDCGKECHNVDIDNVTANVKNNIVTDHITGSSSNDEEWHSVDIDNVTADLKTNTVSSDCGKECHNVDIDNVTADVKNNIVTDHITGSSSNDEEWHSVDIDNVTADLKTNTVSSDCGKECHNVDIDNVTADVKNNIVTDHITGSSSNDEEWHSVDIDNVTADLKTNTVSSDCGKECHNVDIDNVTADVKTNIVTDYITGSSITDEEWHSVDIGCTTLIQKTNIITEECATDGESYALHTNNDISENRASVGANQSTSDVAEKTDALCSDFSNENNMTALCENAVVSGNAIEDNNTLETVVNEMSNKVNVVTCHSTTSDFNKNGGIRGYERCDGGSKITEHKHSTTVNEEETCSKENYNKKCGKIVEGCLTDSQKLRLLHAKNVKKAKNYRKTTTSRRKKVILKRNMSETKVADTSNNKEKSEVLPKETENIQIIDTSNNEEKSEVLPKETENIPIIDTSNNEEKSEVLPKETENIPIVISNEENGSPITEPCSSKLAPEKFPVGADVLSFPVDKCGASESEDYEGVVLNSSTLNSRSSSPLTCVFEISSASSELFLP